jgi:hypothetical protein
MFLFYFLYNMDLAMFWQAKYALACIIYQKYYFFAI